MSMEVALPVDDALERIFEDGNGWWPVLCAAVMTINATVQALETNLLSYLGPCAANDLGASTFGQSCLFSTVFVGGIIGTLFFAPLADVVGRKQVLIVTTWLLLLFAVLSAFAPSFGLLIACRTMVGVMEGAWTVSLGLLAECLPRKSRGGFVTLTSFGWGFGTIFVCCMASTLLPTVGWRGYVLAAALPLLISAVTLPLLQESPRWLMLKGREDEALDALRGIARVNGCQVPCKRLLLPTPDEHAALTASLPSALQRQSSGNDATERTYLSYFLLMMDEYRMLASADNFNRTVIVCTMWAVWGFCYAAIVFFDGVILGQEDDSLTCDFDYSFLVWISTAEVAGAALVIPLMDRPDWGLLGGRTGAQLLGYFGTVLFTLFVGFRWQPLIAWAYLSRLCICAASTVSITQAPELYETKLRQTAAGAASITSNIAGLFASYWVYAPYSEPVIAAVIAGICLIAPCLLYWIPETANVALAQ